MQSLALTLYIFICRYVMIFSKLLLRGTAKEVNYMTIFSSKLKAERSGLLFTLVKDVYYCYLVPLTIPVTILTCYANWVSLKFFRHN